MRARRAPVSTPLRRSWADPGRRGRMSAPRPNGTLIRASMRDPCYGAAPESNRPSRGLHDRTGFEDLLGHRAHAAPPRRVAPGSPVRRTPVVPAPTAQGRWRRRSPGPFPARPALARHVRRRRAGRSCPRTARSCSASRSRRSPALNVEISARTRRCRPSSRTNSLSYCVNERRRSAARALTERPRSAARARTARYASSGTETVMFFMRQV